MLTHVLTCELYRSAMDRGEDEQAVVGQLAKLADVDRPAIWKRLRRGGILPPYKSAPRGNPRPTPRIPESQRVLPPAVDRDPCQRCGTRRDVGCKHSRVRLGMIL